MDDDPEEQVVFLSFKASLTFWWVILLSFCLSSFSVLAIPFSSFLTIFSFGATLVSITFEVQGNRGGLSAAGHHTLNFRPHFLPDFRNAASSERRDYINSILSAPKS